MPIDPRMVKWDDVADTLPQSKIDPRLVKWEDAKPESSIAKDALAGAVRGAGSIGATILAPWDMAVDAYNGKGLSLAGNRERRAAMDEALRTLGADTDSTTFKLTKLAGEVAGTAGAGSVLANGARALGAAAPVVEGLASGGLNVAGRTGLAGLATRAATGAATGAVSAGMVNPDDAGTGAVAGAVLPGAIQVAGKAGQYINGKAKDAAYSLMQSAVKPTLAQLKKGDADVAVRTLLDQGISPNARGVELLRDRITSLNDDIASAIQGSNASVDKQKVLAALDGVRQKFGKQVSPTGDLASIQNVADDFLNHPMFPGSTIPVADAQSMKQSTYKVLSKKYGQLGSADTEAQKALARGLKDEISNAVPGVAQMNAKESDLIKTLGVVERRALMQLNNNPMGLAALAQSPKSWAMFMADRSPAFKALAARAINRSSDMVSPIQGLLSLSPNTQNLLRTGGLLATSESP